MSIASEITRLQGVKADILTAIGNKGVTVPAGSALDDCPDLISSISGGGSEILFEVIGDKTYRTVKMPDRKIWLAQNLDFRFEVNGQPLPMGLISQITDPCGYYNQDTSYGMYYNFPAVKYLQDYKSYLLPTGWRVATADDWRNLASAINPDAGEKLKVMDNPITDGFPSDFNGTDVYCFSALPIGGFYGVTFDNVGTHAFFHTASYDSSGYYVAVLRSARTDLSIDLIDTVGAPSNTQFSYPVRLVKDST